MLYFNKSRGQDSRNILSYTDVLFASPAMDVYTSELIIIACKRWVEARVSMERLLGGTSKSWTLSTDLLCGPRKEDLPTDLYLRIIILAESLLDKLYHIIVVDIMSEKEDLQEKQ